MEVIVYLKDCKFKKKQIYGGKTYIGTIPELKNNRNLKYNCFKKGEWYIYDYNEGYVGMHESIIDREKLKCKLRRTTNKYNRIAIVSDSLIHECRYNEISKSDIEETIKSVPYQTLFIGYSFSDEKWNIYTKIKDKRTVMWYIEAV